MEINYIILAHKNPQQLGRLVQRLNGGKVNFYIHVDRLVSLQPFQEEIKDLGNVYFLDENQREPGIWGDIGIVKGTLNAIRQVLQDKREGYCILLSGQDYPLKKHNQLKNFLQENNGTHFIDIFQLPGQWKNMAKDRLGLYKINKSNKRGHFTLLHSMFDREFYRIQTVGQLNYLRKSGKLKEIFNIFQKRKFPNYLNAYGGSVYWAIPVDTLKDIIVFTNEFPDYFDFHRHTLCADEIFFHSILKKLQERKKILIKPSLTYANWKPKSGPGPATFSASDIKELKSASTDKFFARKFDLKKDQKILDLLDNLS